MLRSRFEQQTSLVKRHTDYVPGDRYGEPFSTDALNLRTPQLPSDLSIVDHKRSQTTPTEIQPGCITKAISQSQNL